MGITSDSWQVILVILVAIISYTTTKGAFRWRSHRRARSPGPSHADRRVLDRIEAKLRRLEALVASLPTGNEERPAGL